MNKAKQAQNSHKSNQSHRNFPGADYSTNISLGTIAVTAELPNPRAVERGQESYASCHDLWTPDGPPGTVCPLT